MPSSRASSATRYGTRLCNAGAAIAIPIPTPRAVRMTGQALGRPAAPNRIVTAANVVADRAAMS